MLQNLPARPPSCNRAPKAAGRSRKASPERMVSACARRQGRPSSRGKALCGFARRASTRATCRALPIRSRPRISHSRRLVPPSPQDSRPTCGCLVCAVAWCDHLLWMWQARERGLANTNRWVCDDNPRTADSSTETGRRGRRGAASLSTTWPRSIQCCEARRRPRPTCRWCCQLSWMCRCPSWCPWTAEREQGRRPAACLTACSR